MLGVQEGGGSRVVQELRLRSATGGLQLGLGPGTWGLGSCVGQRSRIRAGVQLWGLHAWGSTTLHHMKPEHVAQIPQPSHPRTVSCERCTLTETPQFQLHRHRS